MKTTNDLYVWRRMDPQVTPRLVARAHALPEAYQSHERALCGVKPVYHSKGWDAGPPFELDVCGKCWRRVQVKRLVREI